MKWLGIDVSTTPVADIVGQAEYQQNVRMHTDGELQRR
jgi:hypothetical protein